MVKLEKIVIQGFKSFKRKTSIPLPPGFSCFMGPNGCGKTNVADSISFVVGKTSSRLLRAKKAEDLIFHGSKNKEKSDYANVILYFDNSKKRLPFNEPSVSVGRRLNNKGVSTYRLNGKVVTRQQVIDVLSQVGLNSNGHNIIQQGDVNQIVEMDPVERREIIDDISGIAEFDDKKQKAGKEFQKIDEKIKEAEIVLNEKQSIVDKLKKERDAAIEYQKLQIDLKKTRDAAIWKDYTECEAKLKDVSKILEEKEKQSGKFETEISDYDNKLTEAENRLEDLTRDVIKASSQIEVTKKINKLMADIGRGEDKLKSNKREIERLEDMITRLNVFEKKTNPAYESVKGFNGVCGVFSKLIVVPKEYHVATEVSAGSHMNDIVVDSMSVAVRCVKHLKTNKIGRARFLPLDKIKSGHQRFLPKGTLGWLSDLIHCDPKYEESLKHVFGSTACVNDIEKAKEIAKSNRIRMVTLDGDLIEASGAVTGGFYSRRGSRMPVNVSKYANERKSLEKECEKIEKELKVMQKELDILAEKERKTKTIGLEKERIKIDEGLKKVRENRKSAYEKRISLQQELGKMNIQKAKLEAKFENLKVQFDSYENKSKLKKELDDLLKLGINTLKQKERDVSSRIEEIGAVNMRAVEDFDKLKVEFDDFREKVDKIVEEKESIQKTIDEIESRRKDVFLKTLKGISTNFKKVYKELVNGEADLELVDLKSIDSGLLIKARPPGKKLLNLDSLSGGEKTLTAFAFLFAIQRHRPSPFYILDESDATLDKVNTKRIANLLKKHAVDTQFIVISHNDSLVREADQLYGISMEDGESKVIGIQLPTEKQNN